MSGGRRRSAATLIGLCCLVAATRLALLLTPLRAVNGDEAAAGLMARRILDGHGYVFFAGQDYMGAAEQYLQALALAADPSSPVLLRLPDVALCVLIGVVLYRLATRMIGPQAATFTVALYAVWPLFGLVYGIRASGAYNAATLVGLLAVHVALGDSPRRWAWVGLLAGVGVWLTPTSAFLTGPALAWLLPQVRASWRRLGMVVVGGLLGLAPVLFWSALHGRWGALGSAAVAPEGSTPLTRAEGLVRDTLPMILGVAWKDGDPLVTTAGVVLALAGLTMTFLAVAWRRGRALRAGGGVRPTDLVIVALPWCLALYVASPYTWWTTEPRYLHLLVPWLVLAAAGLTAGVSAGRGRRLAWQAAVLVVAVGLGGLGVRAAVGEGWANREDDLAAAASFLTERGLTEGYGDYRPAFTLTLASDERVAVVPMDGQACRFPDLVRRVGAQPRRAWVLSAVHRAELEPAVAPLRITQRLDLETLSVYVTGESASPAEVTWLAHQCTGSRS